MASNTNEMLGHLGDSVVRLEDPPLVKGQGRFVGDINFPNQLHMRIFRSPYAHGKIKSIDTASALAYPGVVAVWTSKFRICSGCGALKIAQPKLTGPLGSNK